jgi:hypothetical protein
MLEVVARAAAVERADRLIVDGEAPSDARRAIVADVMQGYARAFEAALSGGPISEHWLLELHAAVCGRQVGQSGLVNRPARLAAVAGGWARPEAGRQVVPFAAGQYKTDRVLTMSRRQWRRHARWYRRQRMFAPAADVPAEMRRFVDDLNSPAFELADPATQSAFAMYGLVAIHPFQDGNGRTSRLLASVYSLRSHGVPPLILRRIGGEDIGVLRQADAGQFGPLVDFMVRRWRDALARQYAEVLTGSWLCS